MAIGALMCIESTNDSREYDLFGIGGFELVIIIVFALFIFGPDKLPEIGKNLGKALKMFNNAKNELETVVKTDILKPEDMKAVRDMQEDFQSITSAVKNPMSMLTTKPSETAAKVKQDMEQGVAATNEEDAPSRPRDAAECSDESSSPSPSSADIPATDNDANAETPAEDEGMSEGSVMQTPQQASAETRTEADDVNEGSVAQTPQQACANTPQRSEDVSASTAAESAVPKPSAAQDIWAATTATNAEED